MHEIDGIVILGIALVVMTVISAARGIYGRVQMAAARKAGQHESLRRRPSPQLRTQQRVNKAA